eukprot:CAMPEP_0197912140 /NCGR_PEP_ID=MMETSP1439-20131203/74218_1 /TAXON_ID=66791 /ORGANISM="Gonyaulax spinifera, Strain CCMP409" /LENGTH=46 /DNA_ID= /DNA_START= /DNA_END= /DNA_ORIENTATION=
MSSFAALALIRLTPAASSSMGPSSTIRTSPLSSFLRTLQSLMFTSL